ncbi:hypothetical protein OQH61_05365 [Helicobacter sp. MIT 21-1697]|uniref:hypothetical protein n=1 Tax=Helicobacter sp. MIT 21-1697 TaxID=2993733 RepID=UPI00224B5516|nr:hypothetical protein [Helicobacter sp. MIT 21-1697]MCX2717162.1 hypothetical protein [Helicobacter sp. MIT 21-1697]
MSHYFRSARSAFSLFEVVVSIVILGVIGIICSSMLLQMSKNIAYVRSLNNPSPNIALAKIENLLQYAIIESLIGNGGIPLSVASSSLAFMAIDEQSLFGGGYKNAPTSMQGDTLLPLVSIHIQSHHNDSLYFATLKGWQPQQELYLVTQPKEVFTPYTITHIHSQTLVLDKTPSHTPFIALPLQSHFIELRDNTLWLDNAPLAFDVLSFTITPFSFTQGIFLELNLCVATPTKKHCENGGVWLDEIVENML